MLPPLGYCVSCMMAGVWQDAIGHMDGNSLCGVCTGVYYRYKHSNQGGTSSDALHSAVTGWTRVTQQGRPLP